MIGPTENSEINDARLVAFLDGELSSAERTALASALEGDPELRERLDLLESGGRPFKQAFDVLLEAAPDDRLQAMFASLVRDGAASASPVPVPQALPETDNVAPLRRSPPPASLPLWQYAAAAILALALFGGGIAVGLRWGGETTIIAQPPQAPPETQQAQTPPQAPQETQQAQTPPQAPQETQQAQTPPQAPQETQQAQAPQTQTPAQRGWREAVAQYVSLFSAETLAGFPADPAAREAGLRRVASAIGLPVNEDRVSLPALDFRGTQMLQLEGKPIAQIAYLAGNGKPVALCITRSANPPQPAAAEQRHGLNIVHWVAGGYGFMVIGDVPGDELQRISEAARARFT
jgi:anti-sigma factor RsiW